MPTHAKDLTDDAMAQIARLREQVETITRENVSPAMREAAHDAAAAVRVRADELAGQVRKLPLTSILVAAAVGFLLGRVGR